MFSVGIVVDKSKYFQIIRIIYVTICMLWCHSGDDNYDEVGSKTVRFTSGNPLLTYNLLDLCLSGVKSNVLC